MRRRGLEPLITATGTGYQNSGYARRGRAAIFEKPLNVVRFDDLFRVGTIVRYVE